MSNLMKASAKLGGIILLGALLLGLLSACGEPSGTVDGKINVLESVSEQQGNDTVPLYEYRHDEHGNCTEIVETVGDKSYSFPITNDADGYVTAWGASTLGTAVAVNNSFDDEHRLISSSCNLPGNDGPDNGGVFSAHYSYYDNSSNISSILYRYERNEGDTLNDYYVDRVVTRLYQYRDLGYVLRYLPMGGEASVNYTADGLLESYGTADNLTSADTPSRDDLKNRIVTNEAEKATTKISYDANGYPATRETTNVSDSGTTSTSTTKYQYKAIDDPSQAVAVFMRLFS